MLDDLIDLIGTTPYEDPFGFLLCFLLVIWFIYCLFNILYSFVKGK